MELIDYRDIIDGIDDEILALFLRRMEVVTEIAKNKAESGAAIANPQRERDILVRVTGQAGEDMAIYVKILYSTLIDLSRSYQGVLLNSDGSGLEKSILKAINETASVLPKTANVACQGIEGAYSQQACDRIFPLANISYFKSFEGVISAVEKGLCRYGVLPVENSVHGSVGQVYDLLQNSDVHIATATKLQINHCLMALPGVRESDIKEVITHEQAMNQCSDYVKPFLQDFCENTAIAAKLVADSGRRDLAAICSAECADLYGLQIINSDIQKSDNNHTRFICVSKEMEIYPGANKLSLILSTAHKPGALYSVMSKFAALGVNITKLESRPIPGRDFEFMFYFEMEASAYSAEIRALLTELSASPEHFKLLGFYNEI